jgi:hypothetical protein
MIVSQKVLCATAYFRLTRCPPTAAPACEQYLPGLTTRRSSFSRCKCCSRALSRARLRVLRDSVRRPDSSSAACRSRQKGQ